jgi:kynureninase
MPSQLFSENQAMQFDREDPLKDYRILFRKSDPKLIYPDGNSLGMLPFEAVQIDLNGSEADFKLQTLIS